MGIWQGVGVTLRLNPQLLSELFSKLDRTYLLCGSAAPSLTLGQVASYTRGDIGPEFATTYRLPTPKHAPFAIGYAFEGNPHDYLPDVVGTLRSGTQFIAAAGMEDDKRGVATEPVRREAARRLARLVGGVFWIGTERTLTGRAK